MTSLGSRIRPGVVVLAAMIATLATPLRAQSAYADPADAGVAADGSAAVAARASEPRVAPFAEIHPTYVPSVPAPDDEAEAEPADAAEESGDEPRPARRVPARAERSIARAPAPAPAPTPTPASAASELPEAGAPAASETEPAVEAPPTAVPQQAEPAAMAPPRPARSAEPMTPMDDDRLRLFAGIGIAAMLLAAAGFLMGRRWDRRAKSAGVIAKTPSWLSVMPPDLDDAPDPLASPSAQVDHARGKSPGKRVTRGRSLDRSDEPAEQPHATPAARHGVAHPPRVAPL
jgi:hypothetical protein